MKSQISKLLSTFFILASLCLTAASTHHHDSPKTFYNLKLFEGDIVPEYNQILETYGANTTAEMVAKGVLSVPKNVHTGSDYYHLWPNRIQDVTVVPYDFAQDAFSTKEKHIIEKTMQVVAQKVGVVRFVPRSEPSNYDLPYLRFTADKIHFDNPKDGYSCWTHVGWKGSSHNVINLGEKFCIASGPVKHLLLHTLGMWHPSSRGDRDEHITIVWENVIPGLEYYFRKRIHDDMLGFPYYDYESIMSCFNDDFSKNGNDTMLSPEPMGQLDHLSAGDIVWIRLLYQCRSGPRSYGEYLAHPCTEDCPCWQDDSNGPDDESVLVAMNCHGNDAACRGNLVCSPQTNRCVSPSDDSAESVTMLSARLVRNNYNRDMIGTMVLVVAFVAISFLIARRFRNDYESLP